MAISDTIWQPSRMHPGRLHVRATPGVALCDAELPRDAVHCALCRLIAHGQNTRAPLDIRELLETECAQHTEPTPDRLRVLARDDLDSDPTSRQEAARALHSAHRAIVDAYAEVEHSVRALGTAPSSARAQRARDHLVETLVALDEGLAGPDQAEQTLRG